MTLIIALNILFLLMSCIWGSVTENRYVRGLFLFGGVMQAVSIILSGVKQ